MGWFQIILSRTSVGQPAIFLYNLLNSAIRLSLLLKNIAVYLHTPVYTKNSLPGALEEKKMRKTLCLQQTYSCISFAHPYSSYNGEGNGTPFQYSCLENPMGRGAWWAAVHGDAKSWTQLSNFTLTFHFHALEKERATHSSVLAWRTPGMGAWWAAVYGVAQSWTRLKQLSSSIAVTRRQYLSPFGFL